MSTAIEGTTSQATTTTTGSSARDSTLSLPTARPASKKGAISTTTSIASSENLDDGSDNMRSSGDGNLMKFKSSQGSEDGNSEHSNNSTHRRRLSKIFKKGRRRQSAAVDDLQRAISAAAEDIPPMPQQHRNGSFQSEESIGLHKSVPSSLLTEDSDTELSSIPTRPGISPHQSHAGYLTLSSPLITAETIDSTSPSEDTLVHSAISVEDEAARAPKHASTIAAPPNIKRTSSPVGKLKDAFSPQRRSTSPKSGGIPDNSRPGTSGSTLGSFFGGKPRGNRILEGRAALQASPPHIHSGVNTQSSSSLSSLGPKRINTQLPATPPNPVDAPTTLVTPPTPTDAKPSSPTGSTASSKSAAKHNTSQSNPNVVVSPSGNMISHRRVRSATNPPSKLSNSISAPLTPTLEEVKTPGGTAGPPQTPSGFFSSVFSAAQNAATSFGTTIANSTAVNKNKTGSQQLNSDEKKTGDVGGEEVIGPENADTGAESTGTEKRRLAVETLGSGNLSLAQLGIMDSADPSPVSSAEKLTRMGEDASAKAEDMAAAQAVSDAYAAEQPASQAEERQRSYTTASGASGAAGAASPPRQEGLDSPAPSSVQRQGSIRSRISGGRKRRHRGSSATTGNTIAAAIGASTATLAPAAALNGRVNGTGFAVASPKRNRDFHNLFKSVPEDDYLIEDYSAALQKEILLQGRLYVSEGHLCFSSNILGWVTNLVISFDEVVSVEKKSTAMLFPNGMVIQTLHARNIFASFLSRDSTYDLIIGIWKISHPNLKSSLNGVTLDGTATGDKTEKAESVISDGSVQDSDDEVYDEDAEDDEGLGSFIEAGEGSVVGSDMGSERGIEARKASAVVAQAVSGGANQLSAAVEAAVNGAATGQDFPGPATHAPTDCGDSENHYDKLLIDTIIPAPLGKVYSLLFGPASGVFMRKWLVDDQKSMELAMEDDKKGLGEDRKTLSYSYIKPLPGSIGPRQTRCNIAMNLEQYDLDKAVSVLCSTGSPDVPSGGAFLTKTRYCMMWGPGNSTRLIMTFTVEWSGKSWLKGPIEKGANDGQLTYASSLASALRTAVTSKAPPKTPGGKPGKNGKRRSKTTAPDNSALATTSTDTVTLQPSKSQSADWGLFEPIHGIADLLSDTKVLSSILFVLLIWALFIRGPSSSAVGYGVGYPHSPAQRIAAYEQIWRSEEAELWKWMETRVAMDRVHEASTGRIERAGAMREELLDAQMKERQVDEAIRITEERLGVLRGVVEREREVKHE